MDGAGFQGMPRFPLTPAEEALVPRPHSSASQVARALPAAYTRHGSSPLSSPSPEGQQQSQRRPQYSRGHQQNHPYSSDQGHGQGQNQGSRVFSFSFSSSSITKGTQRHSPPLPSSPSTPSNTNNNNNNNNNASSSEPDEHEYPQNPQDSYHTYHPQLHSPTPVRPSSPEPLPRRSFSLSPGHARQPSPQLHDQYGTPLPLYRGSLDSYHRHESPQPSQLFQGQQDSWDSSVRVESPVPMSGSESSDGDNNELEGNKRPAQINSKGVLERLRGSGSIPNAAKVDDASLNRTSAESERATQMNHDSQLEIMAKTNRSRSLIDMSDEERQESRRTRPSWRPSLSLIRQESSSFNVLSLGDQRRYPQNDQRRISDTRAQGGSRKRKGNGRRKKKKRNTPRRGQEQPPYSESQLKEGLPDLMEVLEKRTRYPLGYDDFEAFMRSQRAAEYLNFWADVRAHEQLCRTFEISERRLKREHQLEERAMARDRRRLALSHGIPRLSLDHEGPAYVQRTFNSHKSPSEQELNSSDPYIISLSNPESPPHDQLSFPPETRRYGVRDSPAPMSASLSQRRGSEQRGAAGAYNRLLAGGAGGSSQATSRQSLNDITVEHVDADPIVMTTMSPLNTRRRGSVDAIVNAKFTGRKSSVTVDYFGNGIRRSPSQQQLALQRSQHHSVQDEMAQLVEAVDDLLLQPGQPESRNHTPPPTPQMSPQSLRIVGPSLNMKLSETRDEGSVGPIQPPLAIRRLGESAYVPSEHSSIHDGRGASLLVQSYRTISMEDLEESALRIYRKYLIQLRTASMAAEEEAAANAATSKTQPDPTAALNRISIEKAFAPGWDGYAEQVIAEWNDKWRGGGMDTRRSRRMSDRRGTLDTAEKEASHENTSPAETGQADLDSEEKGVVSDVESKVEEDDTSAGQDGKIDGMKPQRMKFDRTNTSTGITAFLSRLLRTETTVMELPTLTINTTTVTKDALEIEESEYDEDDEYDSDDIDEEEEPEEDDRVDSDRLQSELQAMVYGHGMDRLYANHTVESSLAGDPLVSETGTYGSAIQLQQLVVGQPNESIASPEEGSRGAESTIIPNLQRTKDPSLASNPTTDLSSFYQTPAAFGTDSAVPAPLTSSMKTRRATAHSPAAATFYLPLECRQRIHTQIQQEGRTDGAHVFGPAKGFVVEVVLQDHYYPLFLKHVKHQNLSLLHRKHVNNWIKQSGAVVLGLTLLVVVLAIQILLVMMNWGGWSRPWVWVVSVLGGWPSAIFLATGLTGFAPAIGLFGRIAEDRHVFRFRRILDPSIRSMHRKTALWMFSYCLFWSLAVAVIFAAIPQRTVD